MSLNATNICSTLEVETLDYDRPYFEMYQWQMRFQLSLKPDAYASDKAYDAAQNCIYWYYCAVNEIHELIDWFKETTSSTYIKEAQMESIDILHFVMNIGLELGFTADEIEQFSLEAALEPSRIFIDNCKSACRGMSAYCVKLIDGMPWKKWKTYEDMSIADIKSLLFNAYREVYKAVLRICASTGLTKEAIPDYYFAKNKENIRRQQNGY